MEYRGADNIEKIFGRTPENAKFVYLVIDDQEPTCNELVNKIKCTFDSFSEHKYHIETKGFLSKEKVMNFIEEEENCKEYETVYAGICDLALVKNSTGKEGIEILKKIKQLGHNDINNFHVFSDYADTTIVPNGYLNNGNIVLFKEVRSVIKKEFGETNIDSYDYDTNLFDIIDVNTYQSFPDSTNGKIKLGCCTNNDVLVAYAMGNNTITYLEKLKRKRSKINDKIKRVSFKSILDENYEDITRGTLYEEVNELLKKLLVENTYHFVPQLLHTLLYNPYTEIESYLNVGGHTVIYQTDFEKIESDNYTLSSDFIKYYDNLGDLERLVIDEKDFSVEDDFEIKKGIKQLQTIEKVFDKNPLNDLIITFFYLQGIITKFKLIEKTDEQSEKKLVGYYNEMLQYYGDSIFARKILNLEMSCLIYENFYSDEVRRKRLCESMNLPSLIDFYYCEVAEIEEETSKINVRNIENNFNIIESVFPTPKLEDCGLKEGDCFKYIRFTEKKITNPFEGNNSHVIFPITKDMFDRK
jgi:hypothetical protein